MPNDFNGENGGRFRRTGNPLGRTGGLVIENAGHATGAIEWSCHQDAIQGRLHVTAQSSNSDDSSITPVA